MHIYICISIKSFALAKKIYPLVSYDYIRYLRCATVELPFIEYMKSMIWVRAALLIVALMATSGYRWRCYLACTDQTAIQNDYIEQRDYCREFAQLKAPMFIKESGAGDDKSRKGALVSLFSQCMCKNGWNVPDGKSNDGCKKDADSPVDPALYRKAECAFARSNADSSSIAKIRAEACDYECAEALRTAPNAPRPPSCEADIPPKLSKGVEE